MFLDGFSLFLGVLAGLLVFLSVLAGFFTVFKRFSRVIGVF